MDAKGARWFLDENDEHPANNPLALHVKHL